MIDGLVDGDAWAGVSRVAPRPLPGVTGVAGPQLSGPLHGVDLASLSPAQLVEAMTGAERLCRWAQGVQLAAVKAFADFAVITDLDGRDDPLADLTGGPRSVETGFGTQREIERFCADGIGAALGISFTAGQQLIDAAYFVADVPRAGAMLAAGLVDVARVKVLARELAPVGCATVEDRAFVEQLLDGAAELTPMKLQARLRTAVMARRPDGEAEAHRREKQGRGVWVHRKPSGMATLSGYLTAEEAQLAYQALNAHAWRLHDQAVSAGGGASVCESPSRSFDNYRADALMQVMGELQFDLLTRQSRSESDADARAAADPVTDADLAADAAAAEADPAANADYAADAPAAEADPAGTGVGAAAAGPHGRGGPDGRAEARWDADACATAAAADPAAGAPTDPAAAAPAADADARADGAGVRGGAADAGGRAGAVEGTSSHQRPAPGSARGRRFTDPARVMLHLFMDASTLAGLDNRPATLLGYGPIGADQARALAENAALTRILTDPFTKEIKAIDLAAYRVPKVLRAAVQARDRSCGFPGCDVPAYDTQIDHIEPHPFARRLKQALAHGRTTFTNLQCLCLRHHYLKTHGGWTIQSTVGSRLEWISPTGHSYRRNPEWGPPQAFYRDHDPAVPVDQPIPPRTEDQLPSDTCPF